MDEFEDRTGTEVTDHPCIDHSQSNETPSPGDLELIRWAGSLSYEDRLATLQDFVDTFWTPQHG